MHNGQIPRAELLFPFFALFMAFIVESRQTALFEVGRRDAPAVPQIAVYAISQDLM